MQAGENCNFDIKLYKEYFINKLGRSPSKNFVTAKHFFSISIIKKKKKKITGKLSPHPRIFIRKKQCFLPEENSESQLDDHEEELLWHPVAVDVSVERVRAVQIVVEFVRMLVNLNLKGLFNGI